MSWCPPSGPVDPESGRADAYERAKRISVMRGQPISADEILEVHQAMTDFSDADAWTIVTGAKPEHRGRMGG